ncbi:uncharacterized protein [Oscarella lobularis]|uniref:uncharacterized protein n=1 Tax=Oscarella lobularis TaxID=121494 RepID=UPI0033138864
MSTIRLHVIKDTMLLARHHPVARLTKQCPFRSISTVKTPLYRNPNTIVERIRSEMQANDSSHHLGLFLGVGQYNRHPERERLIVLSLGDAWAPFRDTPPRELLDIQTECPYREIVDDAVKEADMGQGNIFTGEVDSVGDDAWRHGYTIENFSIFSRRGPVLWSKIFFSGPAFCLSNGRRIRPDDIVSVRVNVSDEPWEIRRLEVELIEKNSTNLVDVLETRCPLEDDAMGDPLANLVLSTEWMVKAGAQLCAASFRAAAAANRLRPQLKLPRLLLEDANIYVRLRNEAWAKGNSFEGEQ